MKRIGILTFHAGKNYGASLQCYALQTKLSQLYKDYEVEVINFKKEKVYGKNNSKLSNLKSKAYMARLLYCLPYKFQLKKKDKNFKNFMYTKLNLSTDEYLNEQNIDQNVNKYEKIVFGSDQIWNNDPKVYDRSKIYFGDFNFNGEKISYSASFGDSLDYAEENKEYIIKKLKDFKKISVREEKGKEFLEKNNIKAKVTVDPTMLLEAKKWDEISGREKLIKEKYILYYSVNCRKYSWRVAQKLSKITGFKVINLVEHPKIIGSGFQNYYSAGPIEFLNILKNAEYVVTNSFHGTIFSILFRKPFIPVFEEENGDLKIEERKYSILKALGIERIAKTENSEINIDELSSIYDKNTESNLREFIKISVDYLKSFND